MNGTSEFAIMGMQRTGTSVLTNMLNTHPEIYAASEIFHPNGDDESDSFDKFCQGGGDDRQSFCTLSARQRAFALFMDSLRERSGKRRIGINVKYSSCQHLDGDWKHLSDPPDLFHIFYQREIRIVHLVRTNAVEMAVSLALASATGNWHQAAGSAAARPPVALAPDSIVNFTALYVRELAAFNRFTASYPWLLTLSYERLFEDGEFSRSIVSQLAAFLDIDAQFEWRPSLDKIMPKDISKAVSNWDEIIAAVVKAGFGRFLDRKEGDGMANAGAERAAESVAELFPTETPPKANDIPSSDLALGAPFAPVPRSLLVHDPRLEVCQRLPDQAELGEILQARAAFKIGDYPDPYVADIARAFRLLKGKRFYLEIGTFDRGNLAFVSTLLSEDALLIGVDIQDDPGRDALLRSKLKSGQRYESVIGSSRLPAVVAQVKALIGEHKFDGIFIDGDHTAYAAMCDYANFEMMVSDSGVILMHDSVWEGNKDHKGVAQALEEINRRDPVFLVDGRNPCRDFSRVMWRQEFWGVVAVIFAADQAWRSGKK